MENSLDTSTMPAPLPKQLPHVMPIPGVPKVHPSQLTGSTSMILWLSTGANHFKGWSALLEWGVSLPGIATERRKWGVAAPASWRSTPPAMVQVDASRIMPLHEGPWVAQHPVPPLILHSCQLWLRCWPDKGLGHQTKWSNLAQHSPY